MRSDDVCSTRSCFLATRQTHVLRAYVMHTCFWTRACVLTSPHVEIKNIKQDEGELPARETRKAIKTKKHKPYKQNQA